MATSKLIKPTNVTVQVPAFTDQPDNRVNTICIDKAIDGINALSDQMTTKGTFETIKQNITSDGNVTVNLSSFRYILFLYYVGLHHRQTAFYPVAYIAGSGKCGFDNLNNSSRCYCLKQSYNASTHVMEYLTSIPSSGDWAGGYFDIIGIK